MDIIRLFLYFVAYSMIGWIYESTLCSITQKELVNRGFLNGPLCPVYGFGALSVILLLSGRTTNIPLLFLGSMLLTCTIEYIASYLLEKLFRAKWWDYSHYPLNLHGRICLYGALVFGTLSVVLLTFVHPLLQRLVAAIPVLWQIVFASMFFVYIAADLAFTVHHLLGLNSRLHEIQSAFNSFVEERTRELKERLAQGFEESEFYSERIHNFLHKPRFQSVRLMKAFPKMQYAKYDDAFKRLREHLITGIKR